LRKRHGRTLTVQHHGWDYDRVSGHGFSEPLVTDHASEKIKSGVELTCCHSRSTWYGNTGLKLEFSEDLLLPFEWRKTATGTGASFASMPFSCAAASPRQI
jgi:hypothetical protein